MCPARATWDPWVNEALRMAARMSCFEGHLPRVGGLEDQDSLLLDALTVLHHERAHLSLVIAEERSDGRV